VEHVLGLVPRVVVHLRSPDPGKDDKVADIKRERR
jgi:hypothetical protein